MRSPVKDSKSKSRKKKQSSKKRDFQSFGNQASPYGDENPFGD
jgi:hypothetical protein